MIELAIRVGTAKPMPTFPPVRLMIAELMPTSSPCMFTSAPPELPGLIEASVWMKSSSPSPIPVLPRALMMPDVTVFPRPKGLPIAMTKSPARTVSELPIGMSVSPSASTFSTAISVAASEPMTSASRSSPSSRDIWISSALSTT